MIRGGQKGGPGRGGGLPSTVKAQAVVRGIGDEGSRIGDEKVNGAMGYVNSVYSAGLNAIVPAISVECVRGLTDLGEITLGEGPLPVGLFLSVEEMMAR